MSIEARRERLWLKRLERDARRRPYIGVIPPIVGFPDDDRNELREAQPATVTHTNVNAGVSGSNEIWATCKFSAPIGESTGRIFSTGGSFFSPYNSSENVSYSIFPIIADYDVDTLCWNTRGTLTLGDAIYSITNGKNIPSITHAQITLTVLTYGLLLKPTSSTGAGTHNFTLEYWWGDI